MASQEDATPWEVASDGKGGLPGRGGFGQLGIVRRKPSRPDAPECRAKSCSDKLAQKQMTSVLNCLASLLISPERAYLESFTVPESQYVHDAWARCFGEKGRLKGLKDVETKGGYVFRPFKALTTGKEFQHSRRSLGPNGEQPKPSNIAMAWSPHHDETIIGGVLQGCKISNPVKDGAASKTSRWKMWQTMEADRKGESCISRDYARIKAKKRLAARRAVKKAIRSVMMQDKPWISNVGDESWTLKSLEKASKMAPVELGVDSDSEDSNTVTDQAAAQAMTREIPAKNKKEHPPTIHHKRTRGGVDEFHLGYLTELAERQLDSSSGSGYYEYEWLTKEEVREKDPQEEVIRAFEKKTAEFEAHMNPDAYKKRHTFGESMLDRMENDDWEGYSESEYYEAMGTSKATSKKKTFRKSMKEVKADTRRKLKSKEQQREQELKTQYPPTILESRVGDQGYVEYRVKYAKSLADARRSIYRAGWFLLAEMTDLPDALEAIEKFHTENEEAVRPRKKDVNLEEVPPAPKGAYSGVRGPEEWKAILKLMDEHPPTILKSTIHPDTDDLEYKIKFVARITDAGKPVHETAWMNWLDLCDIPAAIEAIVGFQREEVKETDLQDLDAVVPRSKDFTLAGPSSAAAEYVRASLDAARTEEESGMEIFTRRQARYKFIEQHIDQYHTTILDSRVNSTHGAAEYYVVFLACLADDGKPFHDMDWMSWFDIKDRPAFKDALEFFYQHHPEAVTPGKLERMMMAKTALDDEWCGVGKNGYPGARAEIKEKEELEALMAKYPPTILRSRKMDKYGHKEYNIKFAVRVTNSGKPIYSTDWSAASDLSMVPAAQKAVERFNLEISKGMQPDEDSDEEQGQYFDNSSEYDSDERAFMQEM